VPLDHQHGRSLLEEAFPAAEAALLQGTPPSAPPDTQGAFDRVFSSDTQAFREVLIGCVIARLQDRSIDVRLPYVNLGPRAFNGRSLDEAVVNPFLRSRQIPSSTGPYLTKFRRSVRFDESTAAGTRDKAAYAAFLDLLSWLERHTDDREILSFLSYLLYGFAELRERSTVSVARLQRMSFEQYGTLLNGLLRVPSGGRLPVLLVLAMFKAISAALDLGWSIESQGINVADAAAGAGGDITIRRGDETVLAAEITERRVDKSRLITTFQTKIAPHGIEDYLFFTGPDQLDPEAVAQARQYFAQGHEVSFLEVANWTLMVLATIGRKGRDIFNRTLVELLSDPDVPRSVKVAWNEQIDRLLSA